MSKIQSKNQQTKSIKTRAGALVLDARKVAYIPATRTLLVADMHFEKGSYLQSYGGSALPALDTHDTIERLCDIAADYAPARIIALGDSFHDINAYERLQAQSAQRLNALSRGECEMIWVLGNHDPDIPDAVTGRREDHMSDGKFLLTHHPYNAPGGLNICGHYHPKAKVKSRAGSVTAPCFAISANRIIMPSFGTFTGGLYISDPAFKAALPGLDCAVLTYQNRLFAISA